MGGGCTAPGGGGEGSLSGYTKNKLMFITVLTHRV